MIYLDAVEYAEDDVTQKKNISELERRAEIYGTDFFTGGFGDISYTLGGDIRRVAGLQNLAQQILHRLMTVKGEHPQDSSLGIPWFDFLGVSYRDEDYYLRSLEEEISSELLKESRIESILTLEAKFIDKNAVEVYVEISPAGFANDIIGLKTNVQSIGGDSY